MNQESATTNKFTLIVSNMPARDKRGWVKQGETFLRATSQDSYGASAQKLTFVLEDGTYEVQDANFGSRRTNRYWLKVENGEGAEIEKPKTDIRRLKLPELEGSEKQIAWAESIREKAIAKIFKFQKTDLEIIECVLEAYDPILTQSKWWIDNRATIDNSLAAKLKNLTTKSIKPYPVKQWELYSDEYAHEGEGGEWVWKCEGLDSEVFPGKADTEDLAFNIFCKHPETQQYEIWHYQIRI